PRSRKTRFAGAARARTICSASWRWSARRISASPSSSPTTADRIPPGTLIETLRAELRQFRAEVRSELREFREEFQKALSATEAGICQDLVATEAGIRQDLTATIRQDLAGTEARLREESSPARSTRRDTWRYLPTLS